MAPDHRRIRGPCWCDARRSNTDTVHRMDSLIERNVAAAYSLIWAERAMRKYWVCGRIVNLGKKLYANRGPIL